MMEGRFKDEEKISKDEVKKKKKKDLGEMIGNIKGGNIVKDEEKGKS